MPKTLVIVESPTKAKTLRKFLGSDFIVESSIGHIRDLPANASEVPAALKKESWARLGVDVDNDFKPLYIIQPAKKKKIAELKAALKDVDELLLATDEDREGESISWHLLQELKPKVRDQAAWCFTRSPRRRFEDVPQGVAARHRRPISSRPRRLGGSSTDSTATRSHRCCGSKIKPGSSRPAGCRASPIKLVVEREKDAHAVP